ncbi:MFS transporter [Microbacterium sp. gxy059]|uniref:MFS transporter n=1 Tax=Microbacterium sp. gxy059 TaxID=2957199 RepID=UPI003D96B7AD
MSHGDPASFSGPLPIVPPVDGGSIWSARYAGTTIGAVSLIFLAALQSLAVTTVMPSVADDLDGHALYAVAFSGTFATSVIGMVAAGAWADRRGPAAPIWIAVLAFISGLVIASLAPTMGLLLAGRLVMGLGSGGLVVSLYVIVARVYPANLHGRVMAVFSAAWVVPSLVGPAGAGAVAEFLHWRWVFGGVALFAVAAFALLAVQLRKLDLATEEPSSDPVARRLLLAVVVAAGALALGLSGEGGPLAGDSLLRGAAIAVVAFAVVLVAMRPLLPAGAFRAGRGLPSVILMRGLIAGACFGAEIYVPYLLQDHYGFSPTWAGIGLTVGALTWAGAAEITGRWGDRIGNRRIAGTGAGLLAAATAGLAVSSVVDPPAAVPIVLWGVASGGIGLLYPRLTVLSLAYSTRQNQGFNSSALQISDAVGTSSTMAIMGFAFVAVPVAFSFPVVFGIAVLIALAALAPGMRLGHAAELRG